MTRYGDWIRTFTGRKFYPLDPRPREVHLMDIAHALSNICRYTGHCSEFYSVAQHSVLVSHYCDPVNALWGLLHDAAEAYLADVARPVKRDIKGLKEIEERLMRAIAEKFGLPWPEPLDVKLIDTRLLIDEMRRLMPNPEDCDHFGVLPMGIEIEPLSPKAAENLFLRRYALLLSKKVVNE